MTVLCAAPWCRSDDVRVLTRELRRGAGAVYECETCELAFLVAEPRDAAYYDGEYRQHASHRADGSTTNAREIFEAYSQYQGERLDRLQKRAGGGSRVLEVGASAGQFLAHLVGYQRRCAVEPDRECCAFMESLGIEADHRVLRESKFAQDKFDAVCCFQTLEHVDDPLALMKGMRSVLAPGGVLFVEVPNLHDALRTAWGVPEYERFYFHADHLFYFSAKSLRRLGEAAGFANVAVSFTQDYNLLGTLQWLVNGRPLAECHPGLAPIKFAARDEHIAAWLANALTQIDRMYTDYLRDRGQTSNLFMECS